MRVFLLPKRTRCSNTRRKCQKLKSTQTFIVLERGQENDEDGRFRGVVGDRYNESAVGVGTSVYVLILPVNSENPANAYGIRGVSISWFVDIYKLRLAQRSSLSCLRSRPSPKASRDYLPEQNIAVSNISMRSFIVLRSVCCPRTVYAVDH